MGDRAASIEKVTRRINQTRYDRIGERMDKRAETIEANRASATDSNVRHGTNEEVVGLLLLRQAVLTNSLPDHPHREVFEASRDSAERELNYRLRGGSSTMPKLELITEANRFIARDTDGLRKACLTIPINIDWMAEKLADFHLSQSRDAWTPVEKGLPSQSGEYLVTRQMNVPVIDVVAFYHDDKRRGFWGGCIPDVVAWMPLPAPYEQEK
jgi:hypothetical protein